MNLKQLIESLQNLQQVVGEQASTNVSEVRGVGRWEDRRQDYSYRSSPDYAQVWTVRLDASSDRAEPDIAYELAELRRLVEGEKRECSQTKPVDFPGQQNPYWPKPR